jgi:hypothetical protein
MGIFSALFGASPRVDRASLELLLPRLVSELKLVREQFVFGGVTALKSEGAQVSGISPMLQDGSELDSALKGFQLTNIMGFSWNYMEFADQLPFDKRLTDSMDCDDAQVIARYRERYLDCQGDIEALSSALAEDIHRIWGYPEPAMKFRRGLANAAVTLGIVSQATTANAFGDTKTERKLKSRLRL